jgi:hypothetical protein
MARAVVLAALALNALCVAPGARAVAAAPAQDYSVTLDALWDFDAPAASQTRLRAEM